ncbi:MAG: very short patch repair endonuclease [Rectinema sp.]
MDKVDKATRSRIMASVHRRDTMPEMVLRRGLHRDGFRYRIDVRALPGSPDIAFPKYGAVVFVHGCFWHRHGCIGTTMPKTNKAFWRRKFEANQARDEQAIGDLLAMGWRVCIIWECSLKSPVNAVRTIRKVENWLRSDRRKLEIPPRSKHT